MINATDRLFINSTKAVSSIPQDDKSLGEIPITEFIDFDSPYYGWSAFRYVESNKAYELYGPESAVTGAYACRLGVDNIMYVRIAPTVDAVIKMFLDLLNSLKVAAIATKPEGCGPGEGQLIFQCRSDIRLKQRTDGNIELSWRGNLTRIPSEPKIRAKRVPFGASGSIYNPGDAGHVKISGQPIIEGDLIIMDVDGNLVKATSSANFTMQNPTWAIE